MYKHPFTKHACVDEKKFIADYANCSPEPLRMNFLLLFLYNLILFDYFIDLFSFSANFFFFFPLFTFVSLDYCTDNCCCNYDYRICDTLSGSQK